MTLLSTHVGRVRSAERSGDLIRAYDLATQGLSAYPNSVELCYLATRAIARSGATEKAAELYEKFGLNRKRERDIAALGARIAKDRAFRTSSDRRAHLRTAAAAYVRIHSHSRDHYSAVNAATLLLLAGDEKPAHKYARRAMEASASDVAHTRIDKYFCLSSRAEAALILRDIDTARQALHEAARYVGHNYDAAATTLKQLRLVCQVVGASIDLLEVIRPPAVLHYCAPLGRRPDHTPDRALRSKLFSAILENITQRQIGFAYGSLSAGSEIVCAEACLQAGLALNIVLPFAEKEFVETRVRIAGPAWERRFKACLDSATSVTFATMDSYQGEDELFYYARQLAMGLAVLRAQHLDSAALHVNLKANASSRTASCYLVQLNARHAQDSTNRQSSAAKSSTRNKVKAPGFTRRHEPRSKIPPPRLSCALIFGDVVGFSRIPDYLIPVFHERFMGKVATVLDQYERNVLYRNSWGDGIYVVVDSPAVACECCLNIQETLTKAKLKRYGLPSSLRLAAHFGPVYVGHDPIRNEQTFFGSHTTLVARMEPITPPGYVYVTEALAAALAMVGEADLRVEYVGKVPMAKAYGSARMYALTRRVKSKASLTERGAIVQ